MQGKRRKTIVNDCLGIMKIKAYRSDNGATSITSALSDAAAKVTAYFGRPSATTYAATLLALLYGVTHTLVLLFQNEADGLLIQDGLGMQLGMAGKAMLEIGKNSLVDFIMSSDIPVVIEDLQTEMRFAIPASLLESGVVSGLCVKIPSVSKAAGILAVFSTQPRTFDQNDGARLSAIAGMMTRSVDYRQLDDDWKTVFARTLPLQQEVSLAKPILPRLNDLQEANQQLWCEIQEQRKLEEDLRESENELRLLSEQLVSEHESECKRIASELHDGISQSLTAIKLTIENAVGRGLIKSGHDSNGLLDNIFSRIQNSIDEVHQMSTNLYPSMLDDLGIIPTIRWACREFHASNADIHIDTYIAIREADIPAPVKTVIYRILRESLDNIARHSRAEHASVHLKKHDLAIEFLVHDSGIGFDPHASSRQDPLHKSFGITRMRERAKISGGTFSVISERNTGTTIRVVWPVVQRNDSCNA